ncbi:hypothetical protein [Flavobacterium panacagri]|uniref:hypothetical protein n=1 Tax=Flavobacterium panacagri TaxID=3034146 RepID=UPI0025A54CDB|nr:hypothetical protein [Flavobacterium panacagri]
MLAHFIGDPIRKFTLGIGGLFRWCLFRFLNAAIEDKYPKNLDYYLDQRNEIVDKNGFTTAQKNFLAGIFLFIFFILLINKIEGCF